MSVSVVVLNFNGLKGNLLPACLQSLERQSYAALEIVVVDNASQDDSTAFVERSHPRVRLVRTGTPLGFGAANNRGYAVAAGEYVLFANDDTVFERDAVEQMVRGIQLAPDIGMMSPKLIRPPKGPRSPTIIDSAGTLLRRELTMYDRGWDAIDRGQYDQPAYVFAPTGAAAFFRRTALEQVCAQGSRPWDEDFYFYYEDGDLAWRLRNAGWRCLYFPAAVVEHHRGASMPPKFFDKTPEFQVHTIKNRYQMILKNAPLRTLLLNAPFILARELMIWGYLLLRPRLLADVLRSLKGAIGRSLAKRPKKFSHDGTGLFSPSPFNQQPPR